jgi:hypothetical protein
MGVRVGHDAILKGPRFHLVDVGNEVSWKRSIVRHGFPLKSCRKSGPSTALEVCIDDKLLHLFWGMLLENRGQCLIAPALSIFLQRGDSVSLAILEEYLRNHAISYQAAEKRPSAAFTSSFVVAAYRHVHLTPQDFGGLASEHF